MRMEDHRRGCLEKHHLALAVNVEINADGSWALSQPEHGDRVDELLRYVHFDPARLRAVYRQRVQAAQLPAAEAAQYLTELEAGLTGYTYLSDEPLV